MKSDDISISEIDISTVPSLKGLYYAGSIGIDKNIKTTIFLALADRQNEFIKFVNR